MSRRRGIRQFREARCLGCGCTDSRACTDERGDPCRWLACDHEAGVGVCSQCPGWVAAYERQMLLMESPRR